VEGISYRDLVAWQKATNLVVAVYRLTAFFPQSEMYGLVNQMRRSAVSIPSNVAEGSRRGTRRDYRSFVLNAYGSGAELETQLLLAQRLEFGDSGEIQAVEELLDEVMRMLNRLAVSLKEKTAG